MDTPRPDPATLPGSRSVRDLRVWQEAMGLARAVYQETAVMPPEELRHGLGAQMRRAAASVPANVAEAQGRPSLRDRSRLLSIAWASLVELESHCDLAESCDLLPAPAADALRLGAKRTGRLLRGLRRAVGEGR